MKTYKALEVADILQVDPRTVKREIERGNLKAIKVGSEWRVPEPCLIEYLQLTANNYKTDREIELERELEQLKKKLSDRDKFIDSLKNELLKIS